MLTVGKKKPEEKNTRPPGSKRSMGDAAEKQRARVPKNYPGVKGPTTERLVHELQVHLNEIETIAEDILKTSESRYRRFFEAVRDGILILDAETGTILDVNPFLIELLGFTHEQFLGKKLWEIGVFKDIAASKDNFKELQEKKYIHFENLPLETADGRRIYAEFISFVYDVEDKKVMQCNIRDITERKEAEVALKESEEKFRDIFDKANDAIEISEIADDLRPGRYIDVNEIACQMLQYSKEEMLQHTPLDFDITDYSKPPYDEIGIQLQSGGHATFETGHQRKDGKIVPVEIHFHVITLLGKRVGLSITRDITVRKRAEEALKTSQIQLAGAMDLAHLVNWEFDVPTGIFTFNDRFYALFGTTAEREGGYRMPAEVYAREFVHPDDAHLVAEEVNKSIAATDPNFTQQVEHRIIRRDGEIRHIVVRLGITKDKNGRTIKTHGANQDITERKQLESEIQPLNRDLEQRVIERTSQLNASLEDKIILLREVHHRVKNNLQIIISLFNLQSRYIVDENIRQVFRESQNRVRAMSLVHEKLYQSTDIAKIDLENYIRYLGNSLFQFYDMTGKGIVLNTRIQGINVDINTAIPVGLIINELISNALKHAFPEGRRGEISLTIQRENTLLTILFADNGVGIHQDFDWRNAESLGLRLVIMLVEQLDGTIELDRSSGTMFTIVVKEKE